MKLRFSIRDLLLVIIIAALAVGWWVDRSALSERLQNESNAYSKLKTEFNSMRDDFGGVRSRLMMTYATTSTFGQPRPPLPAVPPRK